MRRTKKHKIGYRITSPRFAFLNAQEKARGSNSVKFESDIAFVSLVSENFEGGIILKVEFAVASFSDLDRAVNNINRPNSGSDTFITGTIGAIH